MERKSSRSEDSRGLKGMVYFFEFIPPGARPPENSKVVCCHVLPSNENPKEEVDLIERDIQLKQAQISSSFDDLLKFWDDYDPRTGKITTEKRMEDENAI